jgi:hypothetical protein
MFGFTRVLAAASLAAVLSASASNPVSAELHPTFDPATASPGHDAQAAARVLLKRRDCTQWWTCGPFKRDKPRMA